MLSIIQVGHLEASDRYIRNKRKSVKNNGMESQLIEIPETASTEDVISAVNECSKQPNCSAIMVQLPLPKHMDEHKILNAIPSKFDIDGLGDKSDYIPLTPSAIMRWLEDRITLRGKTIVIFGRSHLVGLPLANALIDKGATVTVLNSSSDEDFKRMVCRNADIIVSATGDVNTLQEDYIRRNSIVIDVGINRGEDGKLCGDVSKAVRDRIDFVGGFCTPVPGGVGKWTVEELTLRLKEMDESID